MRFGFLLSEVLNGLRRNVTMTVAMILTTAISIGLFGGGLLVVRLADHSRAIYLDRVETQVFLNDDVSANDPNCDANPCKALRERIERRQDVKSVRFLNRAAAYDDAIRKFPQYKDVAGKDSFPASGSMRNGVGASARGFSTCNALASAGFRHSMAFVYGGALFAEAVLAGNPTLIEDQLGVAGPVVTGVPHAGNVAHPAISGRIGGDEDQARAAVGVGLGVGDGHHDREAGPISRRGKPFVAVDIVVVAFAHSASRELGRIGAGGFRLGHREAGAHLAFEARLEPTLFLVGAREIDQKLATGMTVQQIEEELNRLRDIEHQVAFVEVPLSYMEEFYHLRLHLKMMVEGLEKMKAREGKH